VWSRTLEVPTEKEIFLKYDPEVQNLEKYFLNAIESAKKREEEAILRNLEKNNSNIVEYLKPFLPETKLMGVDYLDISFFPIQTSDYDFDFISIIETEKGCICFLAGFENNEILESIYKYKLFGIITSLKTLYHSKEEEILNFLEKIIEENYFKKLRLSISYIPSTSHHISSIHFQKIPIIHLNDSGITYIQSNEIYLPEKVKFHRAVLDSNSYIIIISDKIHERLELTIADFNSLLEKNIFERPSFRNSKELILEISQLLERLAEKKSIQNILLDFYCIVVKKNQSQEESESF
jgi:Arg-Lys translocation region protein phosphatase